jgi:hypothetical protein
MKDLKVFIAPMILIMILVLVGCSSKSMLCDIKIEPKAADSTICKVSEKAHVTPENASKIISIINYAALAKNEYTAKEAMKFIEDSRAKLEEYKDGLSYGDVVNYILKRYDILPVEVKAVFMFSNPLENLFGAKYFYKDILSDYDIEMLNMELDVLENDIKPFL